MKKRFASIIAIAIAVWGSDALAQRFPSSNWASQEKGERSVPLNKVLRDLRGQYGGQHLDARREGENYVISWVTDDGRRLVIEVNASTGRTVSVRE